MTDRLRVGVLASGTGTNLQAILDACLDGEIHAEVVCVVSDNEHARALDRAERYGAEAVFVDPDGRSRREHEDAVGDALDDCGVDLVVLAGYLRIVSGAFVDRYRWQMINVHPALLPLFGGKGMYGLHVHEAAIESGMRFSGATTHFVTEDVDAGPIILQAVVPIHGQDTPRSLQRRVLEVEHLILPRTIDLYAQDRLSVEDGTVEILPGDTWADDQPGVLHSEGY